MTKEISTIIMLSLVNVTVFTGVILTGSKVSADDSVVDDVRITVPTACSMSGTVDTAHTTTMQANTYSGTNGIGKTTLTTYCNDNNGFSIYAIGYTGETDGTNTLVGASTNEAINTGIYTTGATNSTWSMKVNKVTSSTQSYNPQNMTITNSFDTWHLVPTDYTKVAEYKSTTGSATTDTTLGAKIETTYDAFVSASQAADSYTGKVKYVMVHPYMQDESNKPEKKTPQSSCQSSPMLSTIVSGINYMQDINSSNKSTVLSAISTGPTYQIKDNRDNETYCVGKLADNNLWLLDNLALDLTNSTVLNSMSESNTNASNTTLSYLKNGGGTNSDQYAITGVINWTDSPTYASGNSYSDPLVNLTNKGTIPTDATSTAGGYKVGGYYNYCAASAGSYCYGNGTSEGTSSGNATEDICPKSWRMPTGDYSGEYSALASEIYGSAGPTSDATAIANYRSALHLPLSGYFRSGTAGNQGSTGFFWSSTRRYNNDRSMYLLAVSTSFIIDPANSFSRNDGYSVRCVLGS